MSDIAAHRSALTTAMYAAPKVIRQYDSMKLLQMAFDLLAAYDAKCRECEDLRDALRAAMELDNGHLSDCIMRYPDPAEAAEALDLPFRCSKRCAQAHRALGNEEEEEVKPEALGTTV